MGLSADGPRLRHLRFLHGPLPEEPVSAPPADRTWHAFRSVIAKHVRLVQPDEADSRSYNVLQRVTYLLVILGLVPLVIWTGLAMSPDSMPLYPGR